VKQTIKKGILELLEPLDMRTCMEVIDSSLSSLRESRSVNSRLKKYDLNNMGK